MAYDNDKLKELMKQFEEEAIENNNNTAAQYTKEKENTLFDTSVNGAVKINTINNKVFYSMFEPQDAMEYEAIFERFKKNSTLNSYKQTMQNELHIMNSRMMSEMKCPIECMLYTSMIINSRFDADASLVDYLGREICDVFKYSDSMKAISFDVVDHILKNWNWPDQINCLICGVGIYGEDVDLIKKVLRLVKERTDRKNYRLALCKMIVASGDSSLAEELIELTKNITDNPDDNRIRKVILDEGGFEKLLSEPTLLVKTIENGNPSKYASRTYEKIIEKYKNKGFEVERTNNSNNAELLEVIDRLKQAQDPADKKEILDEIARTYLFRGGRKIKTLLHHLKSLNVPEFAKYLEEYLMKDYRPGGDMAVASVYLNYPRFVKETRMLDFFDELETVHPEEGFAMTLSEFVKTKETSCVIDSIEDYLLSESQTGLDDELMNQICKFEKKFIQCLKASIGKLILDEHKLPYELLAILRNVYSLLKGDGSALRRELSGNDEVIKALEVLMCDRQTIPSDAICSLILKIIDYYPKSEKSERTSHILITIYKNPLASMRIKDEATGILNRRKIEVPS